MLVSCMYYYSGVWNENCYQTDLVTAPTNGTNLDIGNDRERS